MYKKDALFMAKKGILFYGEQEPGEARGSG